MTRLMSSCTMAAMKSRKPAKNSEARRTNVLLEEIRTQFKVFGEGLTSVNQRLDRLAKDVDSLSDWAKRFSLELQALRTDVNELKRDVSVLKTDVSVLKTDVSELKKDVKDVKERLATVETR